MNVLFDSNVIIDAVTQRSLSNQGSRELYLRSASKEINGFLVSKQITDIAYVLRKYLDKNKVKDFVLFLCKAYTILPFNVDDIVNAANINGRDFEDDILVYMAKANRLDVITTNNTKDFNTADVEVLKPDELLLRLSD